MDLTKLLHGLAVALVVFGAVAFPAHAVDGVKLINQAVVNNGTVSPGDAPGFPATISRPGSYRLSGNLTVPNANTLAIEITVDNVALDLNGFAILVQTPCPGPAGSCSGVGVHAGPGIDNITVVNGSVQGMGSHASTSKASTTACVTYT